MNLTNASILYRFYDRITTSAAFMFSSDFEFMLMPMAAY
jgi:hypothetical protein